MNKRMRKSGRRPTHQIWSEPLNVVNAVIFLLAVASIDVFAQSGANPSPNPNGTGSVLAALFEREGSIVTARRAVVGRLSESTSEMEVKALKAWEAGGETKPFTGLELLVSTNRLTGLAVLDSDEIAGLLKAIEQMKVMIDTVKIPRQGTSLIEEQSITYRSRGGFRLRAFGSPGGFRLQAEILVTIPPMSITFHSSRLAELGQMITVGQLWVRQN